jgi:aspartyl protease family protein
LHRALLITILLVVGVPAQALDITVLALFKDKAMLEVDGKRRLAKKDKPTPEGVTLITSNSEEAVLEIDGKRETYKLGTHISNVPVAPPERDEYRIYQSDHGMFRTVGSINGFTVKFLVDTGATTVAMNSGVAKRLGLKYRYKGLPVGVGTASGVTSGYKMKLKAVKVGHITVRNVDAIIIEGSAPHEVLLGMSFLNQVEVQNKGQVMILKKKF